MWCSAFFSCPPRRREMDPASFCPKLPASKQALCAFIPAAHHTWQELHANLHRTSSFSLFRCFPKLLLCSHIHRNWLLVDSWWTVGLGHHADVLLSVLSDPGTARCLRWERAFHSALVHRPWSMTGLSGTAVIYIISEK